MYLHRVLQFSQKLDDTKKCIQTTLNFNEQVNLL